MKKRKLQRLTLEQHKALGKELKAMRDRLLDLSVNFGEAYPIKANPDIYADRAITGIDLLRARLDDIVFRDYGEKNTLDLIKIYYPGTNGEQSEGK